VTNILGRHTEFRADADRVSDAAWAELARRIQGRVLRPSDPAYAAFAAPANPRYAQVLPQGIALPATEADIAKVHSWAYDEQLSVTVRSCGHNYAGYSATRGLLVHLGLFQAASVDPSGAIATFQAGLRNRDVLDALARTGLTIPFGRCPGIGISGYVLGGGLGLHTRRLGMASDLLLATRVVTPTGELLHCDEKTNADLFWACRGGAGGNFGVHTSFTFRLRPARGVTVYKLAFAGRKAEQVLIALQDLITDPALLRSLAAQFGVKTCGADTAQAARNVTVYAEGWYYGPPAELERILTRVTSVARPTSRYLAWFDGLGAQRYFMDEIGSDPFHTTSIVARDPMRTTDAARVVEHLRAWHGSSSRSGASVAFFAMGGADRDPAPDATAFVHRDATFILAATSRWSPADGPAAPLGAARWTSRLRRDLSPALGPGSFVNFPDPDLPRWREAYYGANYDRLAAVKRTYDPAGLLRYAQGVGSQ
jgi:FAD/FMN-containing dehydrogenase